MQYSVFDIVKNILVWTKTRVHYVFDTVARIITWQPSGRQKKILVIVFIIFNIQWKLKDWIRIRNISLDRSNKWKYKAIKINILIIKNWIKIRNTLFDSLNFLLGLFFCIRHVRTLTFYPPSWFFGFRSDQKILNLFVYQTTIPCIYNLVRKM